MRNVFRGIPAHHAYMFIVKKVGAYGGAGVLVSDVIEHIHVAPLSITLVGKLNEISGYIHSDLSENGKVKAYSILKALFISLCDCKPKLVDRGGANGTYHTYYELGKLLMLVGVEDVFFLKMTESRGKTTSYSRSLVVKRRRAYVPAEVAIPFDCQVTIYNGHIEDKRSWLGLESQKDENERRLRRRIENYLRKVADLQILKKVALLVNVPLDDLNI